jgi:putative membrane protein
MQHAAAGTHRTLAAGLAILVALGLLISALHPHDYFTWFLEIVPILIAAPVLCATRRRFPLTPLLMLLIAVHCIILMIGGHYTYAEVPLGEWMRGWFGFTRNHYDRIGHFAQGFVPAMVAREILLRTTPLKAGRLVVFLCVSIALAISASYELIEMLVARLSGSASDAFLGTQGDPWDTQMDMTLALVGALASQLVLPIWHDRQLAGIVKAAQSKI